MSDPTKFQPMIFVGIDPDHSGAIVAIDDQRAVVFQEYTPVMGAKENSAAKVIDGCGVRDCLRRLQEVARAKGCAVFAVLERQQPTRGYAIEGADGLSGKRMGGSPGTAFKQGRAFQAWEQTLICLGIPFEVHTPQRIQKIAAGTEGGDTKERALNLVKRVFGAGLKLLPSTRHRKPHQGTADAAQGALHARQHWHGRQ